MKRQGILKQKVDMRALERIGKDLLVAIGEDPEREGVRGTPARWARWWREFIEYEPGSLNTVFEKVAADQMVVVSGIRVWSLCEHHLLPFYCDVSIGYIADNKLVGLSKLARIAHACSHRLQVQERLAEQIASSVQEAAGTKDVMVLLQGEHLCMTMRGIKTPGVMSSSICKGVFRIERFARQEFMEIVEQAKAIR